MSGWLWQRLQGWRQRSRLWLGLRLGLRRRLRHEILLRWCAGPGLRRCRRLWSGLQLGLRRRLRRQILLRRRAGPRLRLCGRLRRKRRGGPLL